MNPVKKYLFRPAALLVLSLVATLASACQVNPVSGEREFNIYSYEEEKRMGGDAVQPIVAELGGLYPDDRLAAYVRRVGEKVEAAGRKNLHKDAGDFPDWDFEFYVVNSSMINAFALPGGYVFVTRGILLRLQDEAELAGLLGHECTHVFARHGATRMSQIMVMMIPVALLASFEETQGAAVVGAVAVQLLAMSYSRDHEAQSDEFGMRYAAGAGYHPGGIIGVMEMLDEVVREHGGAGPEFLSTHPNPDHRVSDLTKQMNKEYPDADTGTYVRNEPEFTQALVAMRAVQPAYDLADQGDAEMAAGFEAFEKGDSAGARSHYFQALALYQSALELEESHAILHVNAAQACFYLEDYTTAEVYAANAVHLEPTTFWPNFMGGLIALKNDETGKAAERLEKSLRLIPDSPVGMFYLAVAYDRQGRSGDAVTYYRKAWEAFDGEGALAESARARLIELGEPDPAGENG